jgi:hypothetical protein
LEFADKLYDFALAVLAEPEIPVGIRGAADPKVIAATLLIRTTSNFKGAIALARAGMIVEARTLTRCCVDNLLWMTRLLAEGDAFVREMGFDEIRSKKSRVGFILKKALHLDEDTKARLEGELEELDGQWPKAKLLSPKDVATGGLLETTYLLYSQLSADAAHPSLTALCRYLVRNESTGIRGIDINPVPRAREMATTLHYACIALAGGCVAFNQIVGFTVVGRQLQTLTDEMNALKASTGID